MKKIKLFLFPHAGGSVLAYYRWRSLLHDTVQFCPVELPGRGKKMSLPFYKSIAEAVDRIAEHITGEIADGPYAFFGHSIGSILAYELVRKVQTMGLPDPVHVFLSARYPPHLHEKSERVSHLPDEQFKEEVLKFEGTSPEIFASKELCDVFLPILRADYAVVEQYEFTGPIEPFAIPLTIFRGMDDITTPRDAMMAWDLYTSRECAHIDFEGGHFYFQREETLRKLLTCINRTLTKAITL